MANDNNGYMLTPVIFFNVVIGVIDAVQLFTQAYIVSEGTGQPAGSTMLVSLYLFLAAFQDLEVGYARCLVRYSTHDVGGLSLNDFICAAKVDDLVSGNQ